MASSFYSLFASRLRVKSSSTPQKYYVPTSTKKKLSDLASWFFPLQALLILLKAMLMTIATERWMQSLKHQLPISY